MVKRAIARRGEPLPRRKTRCRWLVRLALAIILPGISAFARADAVSDRFRYNVRRWGLDEGLPGEIITSLNQFSDGFLWLTTPQHIVRFDGVNFVTLREDEWPSHAIASLNGMHLDRAGRLWVYGVGGVLRHENGNWTHFALSERGDNPARVCLVHELPHGEVAAVSHNGVTVFGHGAQGAPVFHPARLQSATYEVRDAAMDRRGVLWLAAERSLLAFENGAYRIEPIPEPFNIPVVEKVFVAEDGSLWLRGAGHLYGIRSGIWSEFKRVRALSVAVAPDGSEWIGAVEGLLRCRGGGKETWIMGTEEAVPRPQDVGCLKAGSDGTVWAGTSSGLFGIRRRTVQMAQIPGDSSRQRVTAMVVRPEGEFWCGFLDGGLFASKDGVAFKRIALACVTAKSTVSSFFPDPDGGMLFAIRGGALWHIAGDAAEKRILQAKSVSDREVRNILCLLRDSRKRLWVGTLEGLLTQGAEGVLVHPGVGFPKEAVRALCEGPGGSLWIGTQSKGVWRLSLANGLRKLDRADGLPSDTVHALYCDPAGFIVAGTPSGLALIDPDQLAIDRVGLEHGLPDEDIRQILDDGEGRLWLGTRSGIVRVEKSALGAIRAGESRTAFARKFGRHEGLHAELAPGPQAPLAIRMPDGALWFGTGDGLAGIDPAGIGDAAAVHAPRVERITAGSAVLWAVSPMQGLHGVAEAPKPIEIAQNSRDIVFHFTVPGLNSVADVKFRHRLAGYEEKWSSPAAVRSAAYSRLPPGRYTLQVEACNADGAWNGTPAELVCEVPKRLWQTGWFLAAALALALSVSGLLGWGAASALSRRRMARLERDHALERERARIARDIHDEIGAGLTEIGVLGDLASQPTVAEGERAPRVMELSEKARSMVESLDEIVWAVNPRNDSIKSLCFYVTDYARGFLESAGIRCRLDIPSEPPNHPVDPERRHALLMIAKEALNNVVKHSGASEARLRITVERERLQLAIADNGHGFAPDDPQGAGADGLRGIRDRMNRIGGACEITSAPGCGVTVAVSMPLK